MSDILQRIMAAKAEEVTALKAADPLADVQARARDAAPARDFSGALRGARPRGSSGMGMTSDVRVIAEIKRRSPSKGVFAWHGDAVRQVRDYEAGGAAAVSVVTNEPFFGGTEALLTEVRAATSLPVIQKEFLLEPYQVWRARARGADACLLIAACLPGGLLTEMLGTAQAAGLHTLVEVVDELELAAASAAQAQVVGVNNRNLKTFEVDPARTERLLPLYAEEQVCVAESGIHGPQDIQRLLAAGADAFLIGEALMTAPDPAAHLRALRGVPAEAAANVPQAAQPNGANR